MSCLAVFTTIFIFILAVPSPGGPGGWSGLSFSWGDMRFWAMFLGRYEIFIIFMLALSTARQGVGPWHESMGAEWVRDRARQPPVQVSELQGPAQRLRSD